MHQRSGMASTRTGPSTEDALDEIVRFFEARVSALRAGRADRLILDPGMDFLSPAPETRCTCCRTFKS
ncbi:sul1_5_EU780013 [Escherichia coli]|nr:sul1_5_EU780013 [Escherichia coli]